MVARCDPVLHSRCYLVPPVVRIPSGIDSDTKNNATSTAARPVTCVRCSLTTLQQVLVAGPIQTARVASRRIKTVVTIHEALLNGSSRHRCLPY